MKTETKVENGTAHASHLALAELLNDFSIDAIIAFNNDYKLIAWNRTAATVYGHSKKQALGKSVFDVLPELEKDNDTLNAINNALKGHKSFVPASNHFAHRMHSESHYIPLKDIDDNVIGVMNIVHDVAHRIKAERQLRHLNDELEKRYRQLKITSEELASFTYITADKIKEPIRHIYTGIEHLIKVEAARLTDSGKASFRRIQSSLNRMDLLLADMLQLAGISILDKADAKVDLTELVKEESDKIQRTSDKKVIINVHELCTINGHKEYLHVLFHHLLDNAVKFNSNNIPEVNISCKKTFLDSAMHPPGEEFFEIVVADNGIGFEEADKERIFTMFETLNPRGKYKGSGIGLTMAKKIMDAHDGFIKAESKPGIGTSIYCYFPVPE